MKLSGLKLSVVADLFESVASWADRHSPQTLFARALIIIVVPMLLLQALSAWWFYSQRGDNVTNRLALILVRDLRTLISLRADFPARVRSTAMRTVSRSSSRPASSGGGEPAPGANGFLTGSMPQV